MTLTDHSVPSDAALTATWREERLEADPTTDTYHSHCRPDEVVTTAVVLTVAALHDCDPTDLPPLLSAVDPDALVRLVGHDSTGETLTRFTYADCSVTVRSTGEITVTPDRAD